MTTDLQVAHLSHDWTTGDDPVQLATMCRSHHARYDAAPFA
jgi:hypothetical protein